MMIMARMAEGIMFTFVSRFLSSLRVGCCVMHAHVCKVEGQSKPQKTPPTEEKLIANAGEKMHMCARSH